MPEIAANINRIYPDGVPLSAYVFVADTVPPRFSIVETTQDGFWQASRPLTREQLDVELAHFNDGADGPPYNPEERKIIYGDAIGYSLVVAEIESTGDYPGGPDRIAFNLARLALGA